MKSVGQSSVDVEASPTLSVRRDAARANQRRDRTLSRFVIIGSLLTAVSCRIWVATSATVPKGPDVIGPWAVAFQLAGAEPSIDMGDILPYSPGMGAVLAPLVAFIDDPTRRYQAAVLLLIGLPVAAAWCVTRAIRRCGLNQNVPIALAFATILLLTSVAFSSSFTWAEPLVLLWLAAWLAGATASVANLRISGVTAMAVLSSMAVLAHGRLAPLTLVWPLAVVLFARQDVKSGRRTGLDALRLVVVTTVVAIAAAFLARQLRTWAIESAWSHPSFDLDTAFLDSMGSISYWINALKGLVGQAWYVLASTAGLAGVGVWGLVVTAIDSKVPSSAPARRAATVVLLGLAATAAVSVLWVAPLLTGPRLQRMDYLVYGRYIDQVAVVLAAVGAATLATHTARVARRVLPVALSLILVSGVAAWWIRNGHDTDRVPVLNSVISGVSAWPFDREGLDVIRWTMIGFAVGAIITGAAWLGRRALTLSVLVVLALGTIAGSTLAVHSHRAWDNSQLYADFPSATSGAEMLVAASDAVTSLSYRFGAPTQQYVLADQGWFWELSPSDSAQLANEPPADAGLVVLRWNAGGPTGDWCQLARYGQVLVWARTDVTGDTDTARRCNSS